MRNKLKFTLPKGSLQEDTLNLFSKAGYTVEGYEIGSRNYRPTIDDDEITLKILRAQEIPIYVTEGLYDLGISGLDWIQESKSEVQELENLKYGPVQLVLAVPNGQPNINSFQDLLESHSGIVRIATEYLNLSSSYILQKTDTEPTIISPWHRIRRMHTSKIVLILSFGASEGKPPEDCEAIIDIATFSARTIKENNLKIIDKILPLSTARLIVDPDSLENEWKNTKIEQIRSRLSKVISVQPSPKSSESDRII